MPRAYITIGSNVDPKTNIIRAVQALAASCRLVALSRFYRSRPLNRPEQADFINGACLLETEASPQELKYDILREIERALGRVRSTDKYAARTIDLDIALYEDKTINEKGLIVPDPHILERPFLYLPLLELDGHLGVPGIDKALRDLVKTEEHEGVTVDMEFTETLRERWSKHE